MHRRKWKLKASRGNAHLKSEDKVLQVILGLQDFTHTLIPNNIIHQCSRQLLWKGLSNARWQRKWEMLWWNPEDSSYLPSSLAGHTSIHTHTPPRSFFFTLHSHYKHCYSILCAQIWFSALMPQKNVEKWLICAIGVNRGLIWSNQNAHTNQINRITPIIMLTIKRMRVVSLKVHKKKKKKKMSNMTHGKFSLPRGRFKYTSHS